MIILNLCQFDSIGMPLQMVIKMGCYYGDSLALTLCAIGKYMAKHFNLMSVKRTLLSQSKTMM